MYLTEIYIDNFKTFRKVRVELDKELNVFTGTNNAGKTTVLEALALWNECFRTLVVKAKRADTKLGIRQGDFRLGTKNSNYIDHRSISSVRTSRYEDIFYDMDSSKPILISVKIRSNDQDLEIPIRIKSANGGNYLIHIDRHDSFDFISFNSMLNLPTPFSAIYASPVAALVSEENYVTSPQVLQQILSRKSFLVLRNRIAKLRNSPTYNNFQDDISYILFESDINVDFEVIGDITKDVKVDINVHFGNQNTPKDISLLGSGTLQIIELVLAIYEERSDLNLIMLDEPDSHIHRDIQQRLVSILSANASRAQIFLTTHNESLIRATKPKNIFHITDSGNGSSELIIKPIINNSPSSLRVGIQPTGKSKVIQALGNSDSLDILDCLEAKKIIFVEGEDDAKYIRNIYEKVSGKTLDDCVFWSLNGLDTYIECISHYKGFFGVIANGHNLWSKCISVIDADYMTDEQRSKLKSQLDNRLYLPTFIWNEYTIEASLLEDKQILANIIHRILLERDKQVPLQDVTQELNKIIKMKCQNILTSLNEDVDFQMKVTGQMCNRNKSWHDHVGISNLFSGGAHNYLCNYQSYARPLLKEDRLSHISGKEVLTEVVTDVFSFFDVTLNYSPLSMFEYIFSYYDNSLEISSWKSLVEFLDT